MEKSTFAELRTLSLANGEKMPTLEECLKVVKKHKGSPKLIIEIKTHEDLWRQNECINQTLALVKKYKLEKKVEYIAFNYAAVLKLIECAPKGTPVYDLNGLNTPAHLKAIGAAGPDYNEGAFKKHPEWIPECKKLGLKVNVWTVDKKENMQYFINEGVDYITTNYPVELQGLLK